MDPVTIGLALASQFAPSIIRYFTNSDTAGEVAGKVIDIAQAVTGKATPDEAAAALKADPALALQFKTAVMANDADLEKAFLADRQDARKRDIAYVQSGRTNKRANFMVAMDVVGLLAALAGMFGLGWLKARYPEALTEGVFGALLAQLSTLASYFGLCLRDAHQFEFGSSRGSVEKTDALLGRK